MVYLNRDILNEICEKLILNGNQNVIFNFAFSGKESLEALKWKFSTITHLELCDDCYKIGWDKPLMTFHLHSPNIHTEKFMEFFGGNVKSLHFDTCNTIYLTILDNVMYSKKLDTISFGKNCHPDDVVELLSFFYESIKHLKAIEFMMFKKFKKVLNLDSLTIMEHPMSLLCTHFVKICGTPSTLIFQLSSSRNVPELESLDSVTRRHKNTGPFVTSVKNLIIDDTAIHGPLNVKHNLGYHSTFGLMKTFSSIQNLNFKVNYSFGCGTYPHMPDKTIIHFYFDNFNSFFTENWLFKIPGGKWCNFPPKITFFVVNWEEATNIDQLKATFAEFEFDENEKEYVCFRQNIETWMPKSTVFEIRFVK